VTTYQVEVEIRPWAEGGFLAGAIGLQGCWVVSDTIDQAIDNIREAVHLWIRARKRHGWPVPATLKEADPAVAIRAVLPIGAP
jgi:predicted RNase H-like HicB family nuclease